MEVLTALWLALFAFKLAVMLSGYPPSQGIRKIVSRAILGSALASCGGSVEAQAPTDCRFVANAVVTDAGDGILWCLVDGQWVQQP